MATVVFRWPFGVFGCPDKNTVTCNMINISNIIYTHTHPSLTYATESAIYTRRLVK